MTDGILQLWGSTNRSQQNHKLEKRLNKSFRNSYDNAEPETFPKQQQRCRHRNVVVIDDNNIDDGNNNNRSNGVQMLLELFTPCQKERKNLFPPKVVEATVTAMPTRKSDNAEKFVAQILSDAIIIVRV